MHEDDDVVQLVFISGAGQRETGDDMKGRGSGSTKLDQGHKKLSKLSMEIIMVLYKVSF